MIILATKVRKVGSTRGNTNLILMFMIFTFALMFMLPAVYLLRISFTGVAAIMALIMMGFVGTGLVFFVMKKQNEARAITIASVILVEIIFVVIFIMMIIALVG